MLSSFTSGELDEFEALVKRAKNFDPKTEEDWANLADLENKLAGFLQRGHLDAIVQKTGTGWEVTVQGEKMDIYKAAEAEIAQKRRQIKDLTEKGQS